MGIRGDFNFSSLFSEMAEVIVMIMTQIRRYKMVCICEIFQQSVKWSSCYLFGVSLVPFSSASLLY